MFYNNFDNGLVTIPIVEEKVIRTLFEEDTWSLEETLTVVEEDKVTFQNPLWNYMLQDEYDQLFITQYNKISANVVLYLNAEYETYVGWLARNLTEEMVDESIDYLSSEALEGFRSKIVSDYDGWSLHMELYFNALSKTNQEVAICIEEIFINNGIMCAGVSSGSHSQKPV